MGNVPSGSNCSATTSGSGSPACVECPQHDRAADAVHRGVGDRHTRDVGSPAYGRDRRHVGGDQLLPHRVDQRVTLLGDRHRGRIDGLDPRRDADVVRGDDLGAVAEIHLVAVVGGRVVGRGHHDAGGSVELGDRPRQHRRRHLLVEEHRPDPVGRHHACGVRREHVALATCVVADHDPALARVGIGVEQVLGEAGCRLTHHEPVHAQRSGPDRRPQACGAEHQPSREALREHVLGPVDQRLQFVADISIGLGLDPCPGARRQRRQLSFRAAYATRPAAWDRRG